MPAALLPRCLMVLHRPYPLSFRGTHLTRRDQLFVQLGGSFALKINGNLGNDLVGAYNLRKHRFDLVRVFFPGLGKLSSFVRQRRRHRPYCFRRKKIELFVNNGDGRLAHAFYGTGNQKLNCHHFFRGQPQPSGVDHNAGSRSVFRVLA